MVLILRNWLKKGLQRVEKWGQKYPLVLKSWQFKWDYLSVCFKYPKDIRCLNYTANAREGFRRQVHKSTNNKKTFTRENTLFKLVDSAIMQIKEEIAHAS